MRTLKIITIVLILPIVGIIIEACCRCEKPSPYAYSLSSFELYPMDSSAILSLKGNENANNNPLVFRKDFGVGLKFNAMPETTAACKFSTPFFIQSAYACSCVKGKGYPKDSVVSMQVFSDKDFGESHKVGSDISEFFQVREWSEHTSFPYLISFENYFKRPTPKLQDYFYFWITCLLTATTVEAGEYEFNFVATLSDGRVLEQSIHAVLK